MVVRPIRIGSTWLLQHYGVVSFQDNNINKYTDTVNFYISKCINDVILRITVRTFPNQKPWINGYVLAKLKAQNNAYNSGDLEEYRKSRHALLAVVRQYREKVESHYQGSNHHRLQMKASSAEVVSASLPDELNTFYARFESYPPSCGGPRGAGGPLPNCNIQGRCVEIT